MECNRASFIKIQGVASKSVKVMLENLDELPFIAQAAVSVVVFALALLVTRVIVLRTFYESSVQLRLNGMT